MAQNKTLTRKKGTHRISGLSIRGYEIHHGQSLSSHAPLLHFSDGTACGVSSDDGLIWGSYLHGIFDDDHFRRWFLDGLRVKQGLAPFGRICAPYDLEPAFDRLADTVRAQLDMDQVYRLLGL